MAEGHAPLPRACARLFVLIGGPAATEDWAWPTAPPKGRREDAPAAGRGRLAGARPSAREYAARHDCKGRSSGGVPQPRGQRDRACRPRRRRTTGPQAARGSKPASLASRSRHPRPAAKNRTCGAQERHGRSSRRPHLGGGKQVCPTLSGTQRTAVTRTARLARPRANPRGGKGRTNADSRRPRGARGAVCLPPVPPFR